MPLRPPFNFNMQMSGAPADRNRAGGLLAANLPQLNRWVTWVHCCTFCLCLIPTVLAAPRPRCNKLKQAKSKECEPPLYIRITPLLSVSKMHTAENPEEAKSVSQRNVLQSQQPVPANRSPAWHAFGAPRHTHKTDEQDVTSACVTRPAVSLFAKYRSGGLVLCSRKRFGIKSRHNVRRLSMYLRLTINQKYVCEYIHVMQVLFSTGPAPG
jgi:hypothetical protein